MSEGTYVSDWIDDYVADVEAMDLDRYLGRMTDEAVVQFGNRPPVEGKEQIRSVIGAFWASLRGIRYDVERRYEDGDTVILEVQVTYTRPDGREVLVRTAAVLHRVGDRLDRLAFYNDPSPLAA